MPLTDINCKRAKPKDKSYKLHDENALYLLVKINGGKYWRMDYRYGGKPKTVHFGTYPTISLREAREKCLDARKLIKDGKDPSLVKKQAKIQHKILVNDTFKTIAQEWYNRTQDKWSQRYASNVLNMLERDVYPQIGMVPIKEITPQIILLVVNYIEARGALTTAKLCLQKIGEIFRYAVGAGQVDRDVTVDVRKVVRVPMKSHHAWLDEDGLAEFIGQLNNYHNDVVRQALKLMLLTFPRTSEFIGASVDEFDLERCIWVIPTHRMKLKKEQKEQEGKHDHIIPLSTQARLVAHCIIESTESQLMFPNIKEHTLLYAIYKMGFKGRLTTHGIRSTASTILNEHLHNKDVIESQLAHKNKDKVRASYDHSLYIDHRRELMQWWSDFLYDKGLKL
jgi:integrase